MADELVVSREIAAAPEKVWEVVADVTRMGELSPETTACRWVDGASGPAVGARFRGHNRIGIRRWSTTCEVTACEPARVFTFDVRSGSLPVSTWSYEIEATPGGCVVRERWVDRRGPLIKLLGRVASGVADRSEHNRRNMVQTLERLAIIAQSSG